MNEEAAATLLECVSPSRPTDGGTISMSSVPADAIGAIAIVQFPKAGGDDHRKFFPAEFVDAMESGRRRTRTASRLFD
ncbi:hypothetical protein BH686_11705 [Rhodococcus erythropolis]|nr:hypothetical protein BH686_11705 [Rhodococcus erythropolis]